MGNYCVLKIMVVEIVQNPYTALYNNLVNKSQNLEDTINQLTSVNKEKEIITTNFEKIKREDEMKNELLTNISHEFKTPVNVIYSAIQTQDLLRSCGNTEQLKKYDSIIKQNCNRLTRLINNFIDTTRFKKGNIRADFKCVNIVDSTEHIVMSVVPYAESKNLNIIFDTSEEEIYSLIDVQLYDRLILNLLSNSIKYSKDTGNINIYVDSIKDRVQIIIEDDGIGINKEFLKIIFNRFERIDKSLSRNTEGSGLGLNIVKEIVELHKGTIDIMSELNQGTIVKITLPRYVHIENNTEEVVKNYINYDHEVEIELSDIYL